MRRTISIVICIGILWTFCTDYNPFENFTNVNMVIQTQGTSLIEDSLNTAQIFTAETLAVAAAVKEEIDSFTVSAEGNRFWQYQSYAAPLSSDNYIFLFSYPDTGQKTIVLTTYRSNGDIIPLSFSLRVTSPLGQVPVTVEGGVTCSLFTNPVGDDDVDYMWQFKKYTGQPLIVSNDESTNPVIIDEVLIDTIGYLWVKDDSGNSSLQVPFIYNFIDTSGPIIFCVNEGLTGDSVITGASSFIFKVECYDGLGIGGALINDSLNFTDSTENIKSTAYYKLFTRMDSLLTPLTAVVKAWDNENNVSSHTFYIKYRVGGPKEVITLKYPPASPYTTNQNSYQIVATIFNTLSDTIIAGIEHIELGTSLYLDTLAGGSERDITYTALLQSEVSNTFKIFVQEKDSMTNIVDEKTFQIIHKDTVLADNSPPYINSIQVNGKEGKAHFIAADSAFLELEVFDENMDSVVINGKLKTEASKYLWKDTLILNGEEQYFFIHCNDLKHNYTNDTVRVQRNYLPVIDPPVTWPRTLIIGRKWNMTFRVLDEDADQVGVTHVPAAGDSLPGGITFTQHQQVNRVWSVSWSGVITSVNNQVVHNNYKTEVVLSDSKQTNKYRWDFAIKDSSQAQSYNFVMILPQGIDTTEEGDLDLSMVKEQVSINCLLIADAKQFAESDTIAVKQPDQVIKFAADAVDTNEFSLIFYPEEKEKNEFMIIIVIDSTGAAIPVDTVEIIYFHDYPDDIDSLGWLMHTDTGIKEEEGTIFEWRGIPEVDTPLTFIKFIPNVYTNDLYGMETMPQLYDGTIQGYQIVQFNTANHSNLHNSEKAWIKGPFTLIFVARLALNSMTTDDHILLSTGSTSYVGVGVFNGKTGMIGQLKSMIQDQDTTFTCNIKVTKGEWHILCFASEHGIVDGMQSFTLDMWVDGFAGAQNSITISNTNFVCDFSNMILGGGGKHTAAKTWNGDMVEIVEYPKYLGEENREDVFKYLGSKYKIKLHGQK